MKKIYLLGLASLFAVAVNAQTTMKVKNPLKKGKIGTSDVAKNIGGPNSVNQVVCNIVCNTQYVAGTTMDLDMTLTVTNANLEYVDYLAITFPAGITPTGLNNTSNPFPNTEDAGGGLEPLIGVVGQMIHWGDSAATDQYGGIYSSTGIQFTVEVAVAPGTTGNLVATFDANGDEYGATPGSQYGATFTIFEAGAQIVDAAVTMGGPQTTTACGNTVLPIAVRIKNFGTDSIMNFPVSYQVDATTPVTEMIADTILPGDSLDYMFTATYDFTAEADYVVKMYVAVAGENIPANDTVTVTLTNSVPVDLSTTTYTNGFETNPDYFALYIAQNAGSTVNWALSTTTPHAGARCLNLQAAAAIGDAWLMFKCMNVTAGDNYRLTYWTRTNLNFNGGVSVSLGAGQTAADMNAGLEIKPFVATTPGAVWRKDSVDYLAPISGTIYVGIRGQGTAAGSGTMVKLDDVSIFKPAPIGVKENVATEAITVFPNPSNGVFTIRAIENNSSVEVYSIIGENVYSSNLVKGYNTVELSNLAAGTYIVKVKSGSQIISKRVVINK